jgi:S-adenosyl methyltransferase
VARQLNEGRMDVDASVPNAARVYDFFLGGQDNYAADRELAQKILAILPDTAARMSSRSAATSARRKASWTACRRAVISS